MVALVLAVLVVDDHDGLAGGDVGDRPLDGSRRTSCPGRGSGRTVSAAVVVLRVDGPSAGTSAPDDEAQDHDAVEEVHPAVG